MRWNKSESGELVACCEVCARSYSMNSEWDIANLDWHECQLMEEKNG